jgi:exosortase
MDDHSEESQTSQVQGRDHQVGPAPVDKKSEVDPGFKEEFLRVWHLFPDKGVFFALFAAWTLLFQFYGNSTFGYVDTQSMFGWLKYSYGVTPDDEHGALIPIVVAVLLWWKREELLSSPKNYNWSPIIFVLLAIALHWVGFVIQQVRFSIVAYFLGLYGWIGMVWGWKFMRAIFFPYFLFAFCIPISTLAEFITFPLRMIVAVSSVGIAQGLGIDVIRDGSRIFDAENTYQYDVAPACSGIRSLIALLALTTIYGFVTFRKAWKRILMVLIAAPLAVIGNVIRITSVIIAGEAFGKKAGLFVHDWFGFVTFLVAIVVVMLLGYVLREPEKELDEGEKICAASQDGPDLSAEKTV